MPFPALVGQDSLDTFEKLMTLPIAADGAPKKRVYTRSIRIMDAPTVESPSPPAGSQCHIYVRVTDTGIGVSSDYREKIFEKFVRVRDAAVEAEEGTGLGLPIAREIVRLHDGSLTMESEPGAGSTFTVELPIVSSIEAAKPVGTTDGAIGDS